MGKARWRRTIIILGCVVALITTDLMVSPALSVTSASAPDGLDVESAEEAPEAVEGNQEQTDEVKEAEPEPQTEPAADPVTEEQTAEPQKSENISENETVAEEQTVTEEAADQQTTEEAATEETVTEENETPFHQILEQGDLKITVDAEAGVIPGDAELEAKSPSSAEQDRISEKLDEEVLLPIEFLFTVNGEEYRPDGEISVKMEWSDGVSLEDNASVSIYNLKKSGSDYAVTNLTQNKEDGKDKNIAEIVTADAKLKSARIRTDALSVIAITSEAEEVTQADEEDENSSTLTAEDASYKVTVEYDESANIPDGTTLSVEEIEENTDEYETVKAAVAAARDVEEDDLGLAALNISLTDKDGNTVEPESDVKVTIEAADIPDGADDVRVHHISEGSTAVGSSMLKSIKKSLTSAQKDSAEEVGTGEVVDGKSEIEFSVGSFSPFAVSYRLMEANEGEAPNTTTPYSLSDHTDKITGTTVSYVKDGSTTTIDTSGTVNIPEGVRDFEITISYGGLNAKEIQATYGRQVSYTLPDFFDSASVTNGTITNSSGTQIGTISIVTEEGATKAVVTFDESFFDGINDQATIDNATMTFRAHAHESKITSNPTTVHIGNVDVTLNFEEKDVAYTGTLNIDKSEATYIADETDPANVGYLEYTITVSTGADAMPNVSVQDTITVGSQYIDSFVKADGTAFTNSDNVTISGSKLTWTVGDMAANTTKTLTYRVKLNNNYVGLGDSVGSNKKLITNQAVPYSKTYPHGSDTSTYEPTVQSTTTKNVGDIKDNNDGTITIPYTVTITADQSPWPIRNVKIADNLYGSYTGSTAAADRAALCAAATGTGLGFQNFTIYEVDANGNETQVSIPTHTGGNPQTHYESSNQYNPRFDLYVGDVPAGKSLKITYDLILSKSFFTSRSGSWSLKNSLTARTDDTKNTNVGGNTTFGSGAVTKTLGQQQWDRKIQSAATTEAITQNPDGMEAKTIPAGSYKYQVVVNEAGEWNVSGATFKDALGTDEEHSSSSHLQYAGYLKIDYYANGITYTNNTIPSDSDALAALSALTSTKTVYVNIDGQQTFSVTPKNLGFTDASGAYLLTYYATPVGLSNITTLTSGNSFSMSGTIIGPGGHGSFTAGSGTYIHKSVTLEGTSQFTSEKYGWYYDSLNQKLYWVVEAGGADLQEGLVFRDTTGNVNTKPTLVGAYTGTITENNGHLNLQYGSLSAFQQAAGSFTQLTAGTDYTTSSSGNSNLDVTIARTIALKDGEKLYLIISSTPNVNTSNKRDAYTAANQLQVQEAGTSTFGTAKTANLVIAKGGTDFKEMNRVLQRDADGNWTSLAGGNSSSVVTSQITEGGVYIDWRIKVNYLADLSGLIHVYDQLPEGVTPVYARYFWIDSSLESNAPTMPEISGLGNEWKDIGLKSTAMDGNGRSAQSAYAYYNSSTGQIRFDVGNLTSATGTINQVKDKYSLEVQIVTKVTDLEALAGISKTFSNSMTITNAAGLTISSDSASATVKESSLSKTAANQANGVVPFTITVNPMGEDLVPGSDTVTLVDEMSDPLVFNLDSIKVMDGDNDITSQVTIAGGGRNSANTGNILLFTVPDGKKLTITYTATPRVAPNATYSFSNKAYWQGYSGGVTTVEKSNWTNTLGGTASITQPASIKVVKRDQSSLSKYLAGAIFSLQEVTWDSTTGAWVAKEGTTETSATTDSNGVITFGGTNGNTTVNYNTVYKLVETTAPSGYFLNSTPLYIVIAQKDGDSYPSELTDYASHGATIEYTSYQYQANVNDTPMKLVLRKTDTSGNALTGAEFTLTKKKDEQWEAVKVGENTEGKFTVSETSGFSLTGLTAGTYKLVETKAPDGYIITSTDGFQFTVTANNITMDITDSMVTFSQPTNGEITYTITVQNTAGAALPYTGGRGATIFYILGAALVIGAGIVLIARRRME